MSDKIEKEDKEEPRPGYYDRAWNDPPLFSYSSTSTASGATKPANTKLNKRVAFPGSGANPPPPPAGQNQGNLNAAMPPPPPLASSSGPLHDAGAKPKAVMAAPPPVSAKSGATPPVSSKPSEESVTEVIDLDKVVKDLTDALGKSTLGDKRKADVGKRIDVMADKWKAGAFNEKVT